MKIWNWNFPPFLAAVDLLECKQKETHVFLKNKCFLDTVTGIYVVRFASSWFWFRVSWNTFPMIRKLCKKWKKKFFKCQYIKSDLTQPGLLTVALLFFSVKLSPVPRFEKDKEVKQFKNQEINLYEVNSFIPSKIGELNCKESDSLNLF